MGTTKYIEPLEMGHPGGKPKLGADVVQRIRQFYQNGLSILVITNELKSAGITVSRQTVRQAIAGRGAYRDI